MCWHLGVHSQSANSKDDHKSGPLTLSHIQALYQRDWNQEDEEIRKDIPGACEIGEEHGIRAAARQSVVPGLFNRNTEKHDPEKHSHLEQQAYDDGHIEYPCRRRPFVPSGKDSAI